MQTSNQSFNYAFNLKHLQWRYRMVMNRPLLWGIRPWSWQNSQYTNSTIRANKEITTTETKKPQHKAEESNQGMMMEKSTKIFNNGDSVLAEKFILCFQAFKLIWALLDVVTLYLELLTKILRTLTHSIENLELPCKYVTILCHKLYRYVIIKW